MTGIVWWDGHRMSTMPAFRAAKELLVLYEDNHLLGIYKPAGLLTQGPGHGHNTLLDVARAWLRKKYHKQGEIFLGLVHRLDRPVGGVLLLAKTSKAAARLSAQFRDGLITKTYLAVVEGIPHPPAGTLQHLLRRPPNRKSRPVPPGDLRGKQALLAYKTLESRGDMSLLEIRPETGRTHQIRVQLSHAGWPILGDTKYGARHRVRGGIGLLALELRFTHPTRQIEMVLNAPNPPDWVWPPLPEKWDHPRRRSRTRDRRTGRHSSTGRDSQG